MYYFKHHHHFLSIFAGRTPETVYGIGKPGSLATNTLECGTLRTRWQAFRIIFCWQTKLYRLRQQLPCRPCPWLKGICPLCPVSCVVCPILCRPCMHCRIEFSSIIIINYGTMIGCAVVCVYRVLCTLYGLYVGFRHKWAISFQKTHLNASHQRRTEWVSRCERWGAAGTQWEIRQPQCIRPNPNYSGDIFSAWWQSIFSLLVLAPGERCRHSNIPAPHARTLDVRPSHLLRQETKCANKPKIIIFIGPLLCTTSALSFYLHFHDGWTYEHWTCIGSAMHKCRTVTSAEALKMFRTSLYIHILICSKL